MRRFAPQLWSNWFFSTDGNWTFRGTVQNLDENSMLFPQELRLAKGPAHLAISLAPQCESPPPLPAPDTGWYLRLTRKKNHRFLLKLNISNCNSIYPFFTRWVLYAQLRKNPSSRKKSLELPDNLDMPEDVDTNSLNDYDNIWQHISFRSHPRCNVLI